MERYRFGPDGSVYFVTFSVIQWLPVFVSEAAIQIVTESMNYCHRHKHLRINAYVIMPTHLHAIVFDEDGDSTRLESTLIDFRKFTGRNLADHCIQHAPASFQEVFRQNAGEDRQRRVWQPTRHPEVIESERFWRQKLDYLHDNPCRKGLVRRADYWRFSSAAYYLSDGREPSDVTITPIEF